MDGDGASHLGRGRSWVCVGLMVAGFTGGGVALTLGPAWVWVAVGAVVFVLGGCLAVGLGIMRDTVSDGDPLAGGAADDTGSPSPSAPEHGARTGSRGAPGGAGDSGDPGAPGDSESSGEPDTADAADESDAAAAAVPPGGAPARSAEGASAASGGDRETPAHTRPHGSAHPSPPQPRDEAAPEETPPEETAPEEASPEETGRFCLAAIREEFGPPGSSPEGDHLRWRVRDAVWRLRDLPPEEGDHEDARRSLEEVRRHCLAFSGADH